VSICCCKTTGGMELQNTLTSLLSLSHQEKKAMGIIHTPKEIHQQPATWLKTGQMMASARPLLLEALDAAGVGPKSKDRPTVILVGAGTSDYVGQAVSRIFRQQWNCEVMAVPSTELLTNMDDYIRPERRYLFVSFSRSGESSEGIATLEHAKERFPSQISHLVVTCNGAGSMARVPGVTTVVLDDEVNDRGLAMTSSFTNMIVAGQYIANVWNPVPYEGTLQDLVALAAQLMPEASDLAWQLAQTKYSRMCFVGAGSLRAVAEESSLKVLEMNAGKISTIAESPLGLRHGPLSFVNNETLLVAYLSASEAGISYEIDLLEEISQKKLAGNMVVVAPRITERLKNITSNVLSLEGSSTVPDAYRAPVDVILGQLLGLFTSLANNILPDSPSTGAIARIVSHVKIYPALAKH
jgi:tagatose-6-phosphate ketose/aldose isomerase